MNPNDKSAYHYVDVTAVPEAMFESQIYPKRAASAKREIRFVDKAFVMEALLSRGVPFLGVELNGGKCVSGDAGPVKLTREIAPFGDDKPYAFPMMYACLTDDSRTPSATLYASEEACLSAELPALKTIREISGEGWWASGWFLMESDLQVAYSQIAALEGFKYTYLDCVMPSGTYASETLANAGSFTPPSGRIAYVQRDYSNGGYWQILSGEGRCVQTSPFYELSLSEPAKSRLALRFFALAMFADQITTTNVHYGFCALSSPDGRTNSLKLIDMGLACCPAVESTMGSRRSFTVAIRGIYCFAESKVDISYDA